MLYAQEKVVNANLEEAWALYCDQGKEIDVHNVTLQTAL